MNEELEPGSPATLPGFAGENGACVGRRIPTVAAQPGESKVCALPAAGKAPAKLCVHVDPAQTNLPNIRKLAAWQRSGIIACSKT